MFVMSKQVRLPKISSILHNWKIGPKSDLRPFCRKAFNYNIYEEFGIPGKSSDNGGLTVHACTCILIKMP